MSMRGWGAIFWLGVFVMLGGVASAGDAFLYNPPPDGSGNVAGGNYSSIGITDGQNRNFTGDVKLSGNGSLGLNGTGETTFSGALTRDQVTPNSDSDLGIYITGGKNTFTGNVTSGYLTSGEGSSTNVFQGTVTLWDEDRDPGDNQPLTGYAIGLLGGTFTFKDTVTVTQSGKHTAIIGTTATFENTLNAGTGDVEIGVSDRVAGIAGGYGYQLPADPSTVILDGTTPSITAANVNIYEKGVLQIDSTATINGNLMARDGGAITTAADKTLTIENGMLRILSGATGTFNGKVVVDDAGIQFDTWDATAPSATFNDTVEAKYLVTNKNVGNITFKQALTLDGAQKLIDEDMTPAEIAQFEGLPEYFALGIDGGNNTFADVTTTDATNGHILIGGGQTTFTGAVTSAAKIFVGGFPGGADTTVILNNDSSLSATNGGIEIANKGILKLAGNASATGALTFNSGGAFTPNGNKLAVTGDVTINQDAILNLGEIDNGKTILTSTTGITDTTGAFTNNILYDTTLSADAKSLTVNGVNTPDKIASGLASIGVSAGASTAPGVGLILASNLSSVNGTFQNIGKIMSSNPERASAALKQLFGQNSIQAIDATRTVAQSFSSRVFGRLSQMRDVRTAMNNATVGSGDALASIRGGDIYGSPANRIWAGGFGAFARQSGEDGYRYDSGGFILGYDRQFGQNITAGFTGAYSRGREKDNDGFYRDDVDTMNLGLYASYDPQSGFYAEGNVGFGYSWNKEHEIDDPLVGTGVRDGKFQTYSFQAGGNVGYAFMLPAAFRIIPTVGLQFIHVRQKDYQQTGTNARRYGASSQNYIEIPLAVRVNKTFDLGNGVSITPEIRGAWICEAKKDEASIRMGYVGSDASATLFGTNPGRHRGLVGAGVKARFSRNVDAFIDYNLEFRSKYQNHNVMAGLGLSF